MAETSTNTVSYSYREEFLAGTADPKTCEHEWWEDTGVIYTSYPPQFKQMCKLCGSTRFVSRETSPSQRWKKV